MNSEKNIIFDTIKNMDVLKLNDLIKFLEEKFGVSANLNSMQNNSDNEKKSVVKEQTKFSITLTEIGPKKVSVIKAVREITGLGLKDSKNLVDSSPKLLKEGISKADAEDIQKKLNLSGAKSEIK